MVNDRFRVALNYTTYRLAGTYLHYEDEVAKFMVKLASRLQIQMQVQVFDPMDHISIIEFSQKFKVACDKKISMHARQK